MKNSFEYAADIEILKVELRDNFKHFFRMFNSYEETKWEIYSNILIKKIEDDEFKFAMINSEFTSDLINECGLSFLSLNEGEGVMDLLIKELNYLVYIYFDTKSENQLIEEGKIKSPTLTSSGKQVCFLQQGQ